MKDYKVFGDRLYKYSVTIAAESPEVAWEGAKQIPTNGWTQLIDDEVIEPYQVVAMDELDNSDI